MTSAELREAYLRFFEGKHHIRVPSDSLLPSNDPTLLFTSAGMVQFKPYYVAKDKPFTRATSCQRCVRTTDIDRVGLTARHLTFFEMLGNFSFGDYFKEGAIAHAWEFLTKVLRLDPAKLHMSVFEKDAEAAALWAKFPLKNPVVRFGDEDNYWPAGSALKTWAGPNGACSEIYYDFGPELCAKSGHAAPCARPGDHECDRFREIWNLVFPEFMRDAATGENPKMAKPGIDTGMGLERLATVLQQKDSVFETDVLFALMQHSRELAAGGRDAGHGDRPHRIAADHARAATFLVSDGVVPSNEGRGYILRRLIRRATRQTALFGPARPVVSEMVRTVVKLMGPAYPQIIEREPVIRDIVLTEERRFVETLARGLEELEKERGSGTAVLGGERAFYFHDTLGFPRELTEDIWVREMKRALSPGFDGEYQAALAAQQTRARAAWKGSGARALGEVHHALAQELGATRFTGYDALTGTARVAGIVRTGGDDGAEGVRAKSAESGDAVEVVLDATPLYAESGGQMADRGRLVWEGGEATVEDVQKPLGGMFIHRVRIVAGRLAEGQAVTAAVDGERRFANARHHTATHLLHAGLHQFVGKSATQAGSLVAPDRLRFDFLAPRSVDPDALREIERFVNAHVLENLAVTTTVTSLAEAKKQGAMMLFSEKYGDQVRLVSIGTVSRELCGGTHVPTTGAIGPFVLTAESAVASGVRRIEALAGAPALAALSAEREALGRASALLRVPPRDLEARIARLLEERRELEHALKQTRAAASAQDLAGRAGAAETIGGVKVLIAPAEAADAQALRELADRALDAQHGGVVLLGAAADGKCHLVARVAKDLTAKLSAHELVRAAAPAVGGTGGGKAEMAQAGGKDPARMPEAFAHARAYVESRLAGS